MPRRQALRPIKAMLSFIAPHRKWLAIACIISIMGSMVSLVVPYILRSIIDHDIARGDFVRFLSDIVILTSLVLAMWILETLNTYVLSSTGARLVCDLRFKLFSHVQNLSLGFFSRVRTGDIMSRIMEDTGAIEEVFVYGLVAIVGDMIAFIGAIIMMSSMSLELTLVVCLVIPLALAVCLLFGSRFLRAYREIRKKVASLMIKAQENIAGIRTIKSYARERDAFISFDEACRDMMKSNLRAAWLAVWFWPTIQMVRGVGSFVVLAYGGYLIIRGSITLGIFIAFLSYLDQFYRPIISLTWLYDSIQRAMAASERIDELMREAPEVKDREEAIELKKIRGEVVFEDVYFEYQKGIPVLKGINLKIRPGERIGIVGPTGSGKTTLVLLLCRLYDVSRGRILIDGHDIRDIKQKSLRSQIGFIPQDTFLFPGTIMDNIRLGRPDASDDEIVQVCKELGIHEFIESLPNGYQTEVGEKGFLLSAGQRQLIAVARAMLRRPSILILDEALSNVDPRTELLLRRAIERIMKGRTTIVIAHRLWLCSLCDRVVVIDKGRIVEEGTHEELLRRKGLYYELYLAQMEKLIDEKLLRIRPIRPS